MKVVVYHYVRPDVSAPPYDYYHLNLEDFRSQLDYFEGEYGIAGPEEVRRFIEGDPEALSDRVVLTFDDGLRDHFECVYPELRSRGLSGIFFVPTGPYQQGTPLDVHRTHTLLGSTDGNVLVEAVRNAVDSSVVPESKVREFREETYTTQSGSESTKEAKRILNFYVADRYRSDVLSTVENELGVTPPDNSEFYMSLSELQEMIHAEMFVGAHSVSHPVFSKLTVAAQEEEIAASLSFLRRNLDAPVRTFCYPYGKNYVYTDETVSLLEKYDVRYSFTTESGDVTEDVFLNDPHEFPRRDCNEFPYGSASGMGAG